MRFCLKNTQTLTGSFISIIIVVLIFTRIIPECQAVVDPDSIGVDPLASANNKFGIHLISASEEELEDARNLINSTGGDWGYVTILIESKNRDHDRWAKIFTQLRRKHLIPLVRLATQPEGNYWKRPYEGEEEAWADFLDKLPWPIQNRYIIIYNEPNQAQEWGNQVDPVSFAKVMDKTIDALNKKNPDFFVLNAGFDASSPEKRPRFADEAGFLREMNAAVPGIFNKLDGWVSHSYPNPGFAGSPYDTGRGSTSTYLWEIQLLSSLGVNRALPIFITETGWKHAEGLNFDKSLPGSATVADFYKYAFGTTWKDKQIVAVTPFLLDYQEAPFDHFSFKKPTGKSQNVKILGAQYPQYYEQYQAILDMPKNSGRPVQKNSFSVSADKIYTSIVANEEYTFSLTLKNSGQSTWNEYDLVSLRVLEGGKDLSISEMRIPQDTKVEPGQEYAFVISLKAPKSGDVRLSLNLFAGDTQFDQPPLRYDIKVKQGVSLIVKTGLRWKNNPAGEYILRLSTVVGETIQKVFIKENGSSGEVDAHFVLPDYEFDFTLEKEFYKPKKVRHQTESGVNVLDFGILEPDFLSAASSPPNFWRLLPWSK